jgi:adenosine deaminase
VKNKFADFPKVELHLHLDCSLSYRVVQKLAPQITPDTFRQQFIAPPKCRNLADYLTRAPAGYRLMQTEAQLRLVTADLFDQLAADNVIYAELRFAPLQHLEKGLAAAEVVEIVADEMRRQSERTGITAGLILCTLRHFDEAQSMQTVRLAEKFSRNGVCGFDIAADEAGHPLAPHVPAFRYAHERGIACTAHAGEARGPESVWETLRQCRPARIGHGVRSIEDPQLVQHLKNTQTHLEICPSCNVQIDIYPSLSDHPIDRFYRQGLSVGVNTDTRTITDVTLSDEYRKLHEVFGWQSDDFYRCNVNAVQAAFTSQDVKQMLLEKLSGHYQAL